MRKKNAARVLSYVLSAAMLAGSLSLADVTTVYADTVSSGDAGEAPAEGAGGSVSGNIPFTGLASNAAFTGTGRLSGYTEGSYEDFTSDVKLPVLYFGTDGGVTSADLYTEESGMGFSTVEYNAEAAGWVDNVYYPREAAYSAAASYVTDGADYVAVGSKVWTETESTGYGIYTYENTSTFDIALANADYEVEVVFTNPTGSDYTAYVEADDITKTSEITVSAGKTATAAFTAVLVDGVLNLKFPVKSDAKAMDAATLQTAYIAGISMTRKATGERGSKPTVYIASDSTVQTYEDHYEPQTGWGETLANFFGTSVNQYEAENSGYSQSECYETENVIVENRAIGGRSSSSFILEGKLDDLLEDVKPGDYLFVQWGHNDSTYSRPNRYVSPDKFSEWLTYYIDGAAQRGAIPVLVTPVARYSYTTNADGTLNSFASNFEPYRQVMLTMGENLGVPVIDLTARSIAVCNNFGIEGAKSLFLWVEAGDYEGAYAGGATDSTHLQYYGAYKFAQCVAQGVLEDTTGQLTGLADLVLMNVPENVPGKVTGLGLVSAGSTSASLNWETNEGAELYYIYRAELSEGQTEADVDFSNAEKYSVSSKNKYTDSKCEAGTTYVYAVRGFNEKGLGEFSDKLTVTTKSADFRFDINVDDSPTMEGWTGVNQKQMYDAAKGYGWINVPNEGRYRKDNGNAASSAMADDFTLGAGEFAVDVPNGDYEVTIYGGDLLPGTSTIKSSFSAEGAAIGSISVKQGIASCTATVRVVDGQMNVAVDGGNFYFNGMEITTLLLAPSGLAYSELDVKEDGNATYLIGFNPVEEAVSYRIYSKNSTDDKFALVKSFTAQELKEAELDCRAMTGFVGENYDIYVTCVTAAGDESARSNIITVKLVEEGDPAAAPANLVCTSPTEGATQLQKSISLAWDAVDGAVKYVVYRSDKAEDEKGFKGFVKVGESKTCTYTDTDGVATNIPYYYKVAAITRTGLGNFTQICKTPVTGSLVAGGLESYADRAAVAMDLAGDKGAEVRVTATDKDGNELTSGVYVSWRSYEADYDTDNNMTTTFTVERNGEVIASNLSVTNLVDKGGRGGDVYTITGSNDSAATTVTAWNSQYLELALSAPEDATMPDGKTCTYSANDMSLGDLDGDGILELIVKWYPSNAQDNSGYGYTGKTYLDGYDINYSTGEATMLWRIDLGVNIRSGAHYTQFQVWDYDGDGRAEIAVKTADGTTTYQSTDGTVNGLTQTGYVGACDSSALPVETISAQHDYRNTNGFVLEGAEYLTVFNGEDGTILDTSEYLPGRGNVGAWGDAYGNRVDRFLSATAYLDGETPFMVFMRGYYTRTCLTAYYMKDTDGDSVGDTLATYWQFDSDESGKEYEAQGNHGMNVNDIDHDGKDELICGSLVIDHDGTVKYSTGLGHGDAMHISDWVSWNNGLEIMQVHEHDNVEYHVEIHDAETGEILMGYYTGKDTGRGVAADIDPTAEGAEWWSIASPTYEDNDEPAWDSTNGEVYSSHSALDNLVKLASTTPASNFSVLWDGDLLSEVQDHTFNKEAYAPTGSVIYKWNYETEKQEQLLYSTAIWSNNGTKGNMGLVADFLGDWREEIVTRCAADKNKVRIYSTSIQTDYVVPCLLQDLAYREAVAWQNIGYNQPANTAYLLSQGAVTAQLQAGKVTYNSAEIQFTEASDGDLYGHDVTGYEIYRAEGEGEYTLIDTVAEGDLDIADGSGSGTEETEEPDPVFLKFDFGSGAVQEGFTQVTSGSLSYEENGSYGFTAATIAEGVLSDKTYTNAVTAELADVYNDCVRGKNDSITFEYVAKVPNDTYEVTMYSLNGDSPQYNQYAVEGTNLTDIRQGNGGIGTEDFETLIVTVTDGELNVTCKSSKAEYPYNYFSGLTIKSTGYDEWAANQGSGDGGTDSGNTQMVFEPVYTNDFEDGTTDFAVITAEFDKVEGDSATTNKNTSAYVYNVFGGNGGRGANSKVLGYNQDGLIVKAHIRLDAAAANQSTAFALLGAKEKANWLSTAPQILTVEGKTGTGYGYYDSINVNGVDITEKALVKDAAEGSALGLQRDTTGWMAMEAKLNFTEQTADVKLTRISDNSLIYEGSVAFQSEVTSLEYMYCAAGKQKGVVSVDNIQIGTEREVVIEPEPSPNPEPEQQLYSYTDTTVASNKEYSYKIAALVHNRTGHYSRPVTVKTDVHVGTVEPIVLENLVEGTPLLEGQTVADLLPATVAVKDENGNAQQADVTWDVSAVDINRAGDYQVVAVVRGYDQPITVDLKVVSNQVKGIAALDDVVIVAGEEPVLPEKVTVKYTNTTTEEKAVTWNRDNLDINTVSEYVLEGTVDGTGDLKAQIKVIVKENYIVSIEDIYVEIELGTKEPANAMPARVTAKYADKNETQKDVDVRWDVTQVDTSVRGTVDVKGTVDGFANGVTAHVEIVYPAVYKFDFGIAGNQTADGFTEVVVNGKGGTKTTTELGVEYTAQKGYGFEDAGAVIDGRADDYTYAGFLPKNVYKDYALPTGKTFLADVKNGRYEVELIGACGLLSGNSDAAAAIEGVDISVRHGAPSYAGKKAEVVVKDGQMTVVFANKLIRVGALIIRQIPVNKVILGAAVEEAKALDSTKYTEETYKAVSEALKAAQAVMADENATQEAVDKEAEALRNAINALEEKKPVKADKSVLNNAIAEAEALDENRYTAESFAAVKKALEEAKTVAADEKATQAAVELAAGVLKAAMAALEKNNNITVGVSGEGSVDKAELLEAVLGKDAVVSNDTVIELKIQNAADTVPEADVKAVLDAIKDKLSGRAFAAGCYFDISLLMKVGSAATVNVTKTQAPFVITLNIPDGLQAEGRDFAIIRVHNGEAVMLPDKDSNPATVSFATDEFSTYALVYTDDVNTGDGNHNADAEDSDDHEDGAEATDTSGQTGVAETAASPKTGDDNSVLLWAVLVMAAFGGIVGTVLYRRKKDGK